MKRDFPTLLLYTFGFLLLWEWLRPVEQLTDTDHIETFIVFLIIAFALSYLQMRWFWQWLIKIAFILFSINRFHYEGGFFHSGWLGSFSEDIINNLWFIVARNWNELSNEFRTLLFFILMWIMVYLIHYWLLRQQRIFIFFFMTLLYITVLDTFTIYDAKFAIVRTVAAGFAVMGMLTFFRINRRENINSDSAFMKKWMVPLVIMVSLSVIVGIAAPKAAPIWPDPVPYLKAAGNKGGGDGIGGISRIGYGTNDSRLGGPFIGDDTTVFTVESNGKNYWKVETKDVYTGKGWLASGSTTIDFRQTDLVPVLSIPGNVETTNETAKVNPAGEFVSFVVYPAGIQKFIDFQPKLPEQYPIQIDTNTEKIRNIGNVDYTVDFKVPKYKAVDLRKTTGYDPAVMNEEFYKRYTQIPKELPPRIKQLTEEVTASETNWFDKARAVERYFGNTEYTYDQKNVAIPGGKDDYVDQFLFDTKTGYCDNFSSSMAVMLRSIGIPTRWVKGFTGGEFLEYSRDDETKELYTITNNNAHSWVEVFIPTQGWIPFEPTKGFSNSININFTSGQTSTNTQTHVPAPVKKPEKKPIEETANVKKDNSFDIRDIWRNIQLFFKNEWKWIVFGGVLAAAVIALLYRIRGKWFPYLVMLRYRFRKKDETIGVAYLVLLSQLHRYGLKRKENQTLRNYARYIDTFFSTREMTRLTQAYEQYLYHQNLPEGSWKEARELWENLIKKTIA